MRSNFILAISSILILSLVSLGCSSGGTNPPATQGNQNTVVPTTSHLVTTTTSPAVSNVTLTMLIEGGGQTTPAAGKYTYPKGTVVNLSAIGDIHWTFNLWLGAVTDTRSASTTIVLNSDETVTAFFSATMD
ncbi:InlB B-repeat-containing protein [Dehalogenimonas etheniformans]|uniref:InlB B-repeat-containing protein n=1 Tax=Dehalogenimonas etheniformans TaxID=1536648 RepID=UPI0013922363|nr:hypothetical protein [Dehalogenimonas etheniformans]QNT75454.1 hypothetical protein HX448_01495 [Dehalogenimonas etheniformans]